MRWVIFHLLHLSLSAAPRRVEMKIFVLWRGGGTHKVERKADTVEKEERSWTPKKIRELSIKSPSTCAVEGAFISHTRWMFNGSIALQFSIFVQKDRSSAKPQHGRKFHQQKYKAHKNVAAPWLQPKVDNYMENLPHPKKLGALTLAVVYSSSSTSDDSIGSLIFCCNHMRNLCCMLKWLTALCAMWLEW